MKASSRAVSGKGDITALAVMAPPAAILKAVEGVAEHWLALANLAAASFVGLSVAAPLLLALGWTDAALFIYAAYGFTCHQWPFRSFFVLGSQPTHSYEALVSAVGFSQVYDFVGNAQLGYKLAFCERDLGIYAAILLAGLGYVWLRRRLEPAPFGVYLLLLVPIALDGFTQLFGWRESTWELRLVTGALFGVASVWLVYPRFERFLLTRGLKQDRSGLLERAR